MNKNKELSMENERDFLIIENFTQEEINEEFEKLKKNLLRTFSELRKRKNKNFKISDCTAPKILDTRLEVQFL